MTLDDILGEDDERVADNRVKPALLSLLNDQHELLSEEPNLITGFEKHRDLISWYQRAGVRTLGEVAEDWPPESCGFHAVIVGALVDESPFPEVSGREEFRRRLQSSVILPACNRGYRRLRDHAAEYVKSDEVDDERVDLDPLEQEYVAMRPGFESLDRQQSAVLDSLWGGFEDRSALSEWLHALNSPTNGEIATDIARITMEDPVAVSHLLGSGSPKRDRLYRAWYASVHLLPAFIEGVRNADTAELAQATRDGPRTLRMGSNE